MGRSGGWTRGGASRGPRRRRGAAFTAGELRLTILAGLLAGLVCFEAGRTAPADGWLPSARAWGEAAAAGVGIGSGVRVIDGDTFVHGGERIRIADIDTPEVHGRCPEESALAARATDRLRTLLAEGPFELHPLPSGRDEDRYGRKLRIVTRDGRSLGDVLVAEGLARTWSGRREPWCA